MTDAVRAMLQTGKATPKAMRELLDIANRDFPLNGTTANSAHRSSLDALFDQISCARDLLGNGAPLTLKRAISIELSSLEQKASASREKLQLDLKRAISADRTDHIAALQGALGTYAKVTTADLQGRTIRLSSPSPPPSPSAPADRSLADTLIANLLDDSSDETAAAARCMTTARRFQCAHVVDSFLEPDEQIRRNQRPDVAFFDLNTAMTELLAAKHAARCMNVSDSSPVHDALSSIELDINRAIRCCVRVLDNPRSAQIPAYVELAISWLGAHHPNVVSFQHRRIQTADALMAACQADMPPAVPQPLATLTEVVRRAQQHADPSNIVSELLSVAQSEYQFDRLNAPVPDPYLTLSERLNGNFDSLTTASKDIRAALMEAMYLPRNAVTRSIRATLVQMDEATTRAIRSWEAMLVTSNASPEQAMVNLAISWLGTNHPVVRDRARTTDPLMHWASR